MHPAANGINAAKVIIAYIGVAGLGVLSLSAMIMIAGTPLFERISPH